MKPKSALPAVALAVIATLLPVASRADTATVKAGVGVVDATWHVGASAGQYASDGLTVGEHGVDPFTHSTRRSPSYGVQSRNSVRALVVEGTDGTRVALVKNDLYIPQDLLNERIATILEDHDRQVTLGLPQEIAGPVTNINHSNMMVAVSHSHSSPYYSTPSWGVWAFQDVFDLRFFEYMAQQSAEAVIQAVAGLVPARMGATTVFYNRAKHHSFGPAKADDGTPAGFPKADGDLTISVLRFDQIDPTSKEFVAPLATFMNLGLHPEMLEGNNLITGEYIAPLERMVDRATGGRLIFAQNDTGTSETARNCQPHNDCSLRAEYDHKEYAQTERAARTIADAVLQGWNEIGAGLGTVSFDDDFYVKMIDRQFAPPYSHPYPSVSNCRTHEAFDGNPGVPIIGLPDCERFTGGAMKPLFNELGPYDPGVTYGELKKAGIPLPENYSAPSYSGLQETIQVHLQAIRLGEVLITVCPCEQWSDQSKNIKSRANKAQADQYNGYNWDCTQNPESTWSCIHPKISPAAKISDLLIKRMRAQVNNPANGWDELANAATAEAESPVISQIKGNYTHEELPADYGYDLVMPVGMANDYWGYIATYREYSRGDHYRKALTGLGPHSSDFLATRLVRMGGSLKGCPVYLCPTDYNALDMAYMVDGVHQHARAEAIGRDAQVYLAAYEALVLPDLGTPSITAQPESIERFDVSRVTWIGGNNYIDDPQVRVERLENGNWVEAAGQSGEVVVTVDYPLEASESILDKGHEWRWTAAFEAFDTEIDTGRASEAVPGAGSQTPAGTYRFVIYGERKAPTGREAYHLVSSDFTISPWDGIEVSDLQAGRNGVSFLVGPVNVKEYNVGDYPVEGGTGKVNVSSGTVGHIDYPDALPSSKLPAFPEMGDKLFPRLERTSIGGQLYCFPCTFRPWLDTGTVESAQVLVKRKGRGPEVVEATLVNGRWTAAVTLSSGDCVTVRRGDVVDTFGEFNGLRTRKVCL